MSGPGPLPGYIIDAELHAALPALLEVAQAFKECQKFAQTVHIKGTDDPEGEHALDELLFKLIPD
jgi:hypothetical protein